MAMTTVAKRSGALLVLGLLCLGLLSCTSSTAPKAGTVEAELLEDAPRREGVPAVLVLLPVSAHTREAWRSLRDELVTSFDVVTRPVTEASTKLELANEIARVKPQCVVLLGNTSTNLYREYQDSGLGAVPPAVVLMVSFFEEQHKAFRNTTGIAYEVPGITTFVNLRSFIYRPVQRVGVIHRPLFAPYVSRQAELARVEQVQLVALEVSDDPGPHEIRRAIDTLVVRQGVDALWVLNDNALLQPELIAKGWLRMLHKHPVAVVVGVSSLVDTRLHFGSFAMLPDHAALGVQAADLVFRLADEGWNADVIPVQQPISVQSVVDLPWTRRHFQFREEAIDRIDRIVE
jgi:hypothetical protein